MSKRALAPFCVMVKNMNDFSPRMEKAEVDKISMLGLAHMGDCVYELLIRTMLCKKGLNSVSNLHKVTVKYVNAPAQAKAAEKILPVLSESEQAIYRRGRNAKVNSVPHNASIGEYHAATGLEALFGYLYLMGNTQRVSELFDVISEDY